MLDIERQEGGLVMVLVPFLFSVESIELYLRTRKNATAQSKDDLPP